MRYAVLADIHSNLEALEAVLAELGEMRIDHYVCAGDIVGYGADPVACIERVRDLCDLVVAGNHDWAVADTLSMEFFNAHARAAIHWTREQISSSDVEWLAELPIQGDVDRKTLLVHSTVHDPHNFDYLLTSYDAILSMKALRKPLCFVGHSHIPITFLERGGVGFTWADVIDLTRVEKAIVNPGSVGQPRDKNPHAAYAIYDTVKRRVTLHRVAYDVEKASAKIRAAGLPEPLAARIAVGD